MYQKSNLSSEVSMQKFQQISLCFVLGLKTISIGKNGKLILDILMLLFSHPIKMNGEIQNLLNGTNLFAEGLLKSRKNLKISFSLRAVMFILWL